MVRGLVLFALVATDLGLRALDVGSLQLAASDRTLERAQVLALGEVVEIRWREDEAFFEALPVFSGPRGG